MRHVFGVYCSLVVRLEIKMISCNDWIGKHEVRNCLLSAWDYFMQGAVLIHYVCKLTSLIRVKLA